MQIGMVGLGRMGANMARRLLEHGHHVVGHDLSGDAMRALADAGGTPADSLEELVAALEAPRAVWLMVPAGHVTEQNVRALTPLLAAGDVVVDGGNSRWTDTKRRAALLAEQGIAFLDVGTSGGVWGLTEGYCLMVGGDEDACRRLEPVFTSLAPEQGWARVGPSGAGHFTKMVHNGVEYALMQAYGEGFELLDASEYDFDLGGVAQLWRHGSVIRSWLLDLAARALADDPELRTVRGYIEDSGEGRWTVEAAIDQATPTPTIALALFARFASRRDDAFGNRLIAALRREFGGHAVRERDDA